MMKSRTIRSVVLAGFVGILTLPALRADLASPSDAYAQAVSDYVSAATKETGTVRAELERNEKEGRQANWAAVRSSLQHCQALIDELKVVSANEFDPTKAKYEQARADLQSKLAVARQG